MNQVMSFKERVFQSVLFESLAVGMCITGLAIFTEHDIDELSGMMILIATIAMIWNFVFNWGFDKVKPGPKEQRSLSLRVIHVIAFEIGLLIFTIPVMAVILKVGIWEAFLMDIGVTIFITIYAFTFNLVYDNVRASLMKVNTQSIELKDIH